MVMVQVGLVVQLTVTNPAKRPPFKTGRMPPPRPPPPSREPSSGSGKLQDSDEEDILTEEEEEGVCNSLDQLMVAENPPIRAVTNPRLYQLTSLGQSTGLWWDSFEEDLEELGLGGEDKFWVGFTGAYNKSVLFLTFSWLAI